MNIRIVAACLAVLLNANTIFAAIYTPGGPVYVNPEQEIQATPSQQTINYVTQTVYGFLDFTTTIGNTVMLFSPQSSSSAVAPTSVVEEVKPTKVEEKKPVVVTKEIKASQVEEKKPIVTIKEIKASPPSSIVNVVASIEKPDRPSIVSVVNVVQPVSVVTSSKTQIISTKVDVIVHKETVTPSIPTEAPVEEVSPQIEEKPFDGLTIESSIVEINSNVNSDIPVQIPNNIGEPEYDFLSRQPAEYVEETYRVHNLRGGKPQLKQRPTEAPRRDTLHPTGLVTKLGGTVVKDGVTTIHETSVIGTYISGKYAQVLQSSSQIFHNPNKAKIAPSPSLKILKTAAPAIAKDRRYSVEATPSLDSYEDTLTTAPGRKRPVAIPPTSPADFKSRFRNRKYTPESNQDYTDDVTPAAEKITTKKFRSNQKYNRPSSEVNTVSVFPETSSVPAFRRNKASRHDFKTTSTVTQNDSYSRRGFKPRPHPTNVDAEQQTTSLYKFKLNRTPGRWQYKTTPKPRVNIRKSTDEPKETATETTNPEGRTEDGDLDGQPSLTGDILEDDGRNGIEKPLPVETLKVEISTPSDFADIYYEIATIKSPYTFQVGPMKKTRFITVTSTFEKTLEPETSTTELTGPLTENILATTSHLDSEHNLLDSTIATLPPLYLTDIGETPSLETLTETFSTSHVLLKTHILPIVYNENSTDSHTLIQTYHVTRLVTATKTLPPMESYHFVPSKTFNEFNSRLDEAGSELHLELEFGDNNEEDEDDEGLRQELPAELDLSKVGTDLDLLGLDRVPIAAPPKAKHPKVTKTPVLEATTPKSSESIQPEIQQLLRLLNPAAAANLPQVITSSKPVIKLETVYDSHVIPIFNGVSTIFSTLTRPIGTVTKTDYEYETTTIQPSLPIPPVPMNPLFPPQQQFQVTSAPIVQNTVVTLTDSKVLKLTFGAKTAYTTLFSTHVTPTLVTTFVTTSVPVAPVNGAAFPGYFPAPYAPFPYVG
ncbi:mucin-2 isoform X2 [Lutzomyia longipalpis]|nr:mucin-2 isoform X2 [Lutzomyia longipalpis]XP_055693690.1 mucin-2 isoform X2 [Lutzomyia longipalpis]